MTNQDVPVVKCFFYNNQYYVYDTYSNSLLEVSREQYLEICTLCRIGLNKYISLNKNTKEYNDILMLVNKGMFKFSFIDKIIHPVTGYITPLVSRCVNDITLQVTRNCNFKCRYCLFANSNEITRGHEHQDMDWETARKSVDFLYDHSKDAQEVSISFYGGEPLLNYSLIKKTVEYTNDKFFSKKVNYRMTINGSILSDEIMKFICDNNFEIAISLDGKEDIQNQHRIFNKTGEGTYSIVYNNILKLKSTYPNYFESNVSFMPVFFADENREEIFDFFLANGVAANKIILLEADLNGVDYINSGVRGNILKDQYINYIESENDSVFDDYYISKMKLPLFWHHNGPCIPGIKRLFVSYNGEFYSCEKILEYDELSIGNIDLGFNEEKINDMLNIGLLTENECKKCWAMRYCNICHAQCIDLDKRELSAKRKPCDYQKSTLLKYLKRKIDFTKQKVEN